MPAGTVPSVTEIPGTLSALVAGQEGMVARWQALGLGMTERMLSHRLSGGQWSVQYPGVYATFSGQPTRAAQLWAAVLLCSREVTHPRRRDRSAGLPEPDAVLSHATAAELHRLGSPLTAQAEGRPIHVTIPSGRRKPQADQVIRVHFSSRLVESRHPTTSPPRTRINDTVIDLTQSARTLDDAIGWLTAACGSRRTTATRLAEAIHARKKLRWRCELLYALGDAAAGDHSLLELRYHRNVERAHGLPEAGRQRRRTEQRRVARADHRAGSARTEYDDVSYLAYRTVVHLDGKVHLYSRFRDMRRDNAAVVRADDPLHYGWTDVDDHPCEVAAQVAVVLIRNGWRGRPRRCRPGCAVAQIL